MHPYALEGADLTTRPIRFVLHGTCPWRRPKLNSTLPSHKRVIAELHTDSRRVVRVVMDILPTHPVRLLSAQTDVDETSRAITPWTAQLFRDDSDGRLRRPLGLRRESQPAVVAH